MATVNLGRIKFVWQGAYNGATAYVADDVVSYNGSSYICILASTGNLPTNTTYWNLMAQTGTDITSIAGLAQGDVLYYNGTAWVRLGAGTSGQYLKTNGASANPSWANGSASTLTTQGDILYRDASGLQRLGAGTSGQFLKTNGAGANPSWGTVSQKVLQLLSTTKTDTQSNGSQSMVAITGLTVTITPRDANSTFYLIGNVNLGTGGANADAHLKFTRTIGGSTTDIIIADTAGSRSRDTWNGGDDALASIYNSVGIPITGLDAPATTSAITYGIKFGSLEGTQSLYINRTGADADGLRDGRGTSTITVMEIGN